MWVQSSRHLRHLELPGIDYFCARSRPARRAWSPNDLPHLHVVLARFEWSKPTALTRISATAVRAFDPGWSRGRIGRYLVLGLQVGASGSQANQAFSRSEKIGERLAERPAVAKDLLELFRPVVLFPAAAVVFPAACQRALPLPPSCGFFAAITATTPASTSGLLSSGSISPGSSGRIDR